MDDRTGASPGASAMALLQQGVALHQQGGLAEAEALYRRALALAPRSFDALHLLGVLRHQTGQHDEAIALIDAAIAVNPREAPAHSNRGLALAALGHLDEAVASFDRALVLRGDYADALLNRGNVQARLGRHAEALASFEAVLALRAEDLAAMSGRGNALAALRRHAEALDTFERVLRVRPDDGAALNNRGNLLLELGRSDEALACYDRLIAIRPDDPVTLTNRAVALQALDRPLEALEACDRALASNPGSAPAHNGRGRALLALKRPQDALASFDRAFACAPPAGRDRLEATNNRGAALLDLVREDEALDCFDRVLALDPDYAEALNNRGLALRELRRIPEALECFARAIAVRPTYGRAHLNEALCRLLTGDLAEGWRKFEYRWQEMPHKRAWRDFGKPRWDVNADVAGKTVLLHAEQGLGDTLQFCRYLPLVAERGATVLLEAPPVLHPVLASLHGVSRLLARGDALPAFDFHCPLMGLPLAFETRIGTIPARVPYLRSPADAVRRWTATLGARRAPRVGVAWAGNPTHANDRRRSIPLERFSGLLGAPAQFVSLQYEIRPDDAAALPGFPQLAHFGEALRDFGETAAVIDLVDLVIAVDTSVAHLAGAMGKPVWILLPFVPDWRWLLEGDGSCWYPTARLFRQPRAGDWDDVLHHAGIALRREIAARS